MALASGRLACIVLLSGVLTAHALAQAPSAPAATLAGIVMDPSGGVMQAVTVRVFEGGGDEPLREVRTDPEGRFAVELRTGERRWHYQLVHHGIWDHDHPLRS